MLLFDIIGQSLEIRVNNEVKKNGSTVQLASFTNTDISISCYYDYYGGSEPPTFSEVGSTRELPSTRRINEYGRHYLEYVIPRSEKQSIHRYKCATSSTFVQVVLNYSHNCKLMCIMSLALHSRLQ